MAEKFAMTKNVKRFIRGVEMVGTPIKGRIGNGLFFGAPGTGKSEVGQWYAAKESVPYIRAKDISSRRSLLSNIVAELGEAPSYTSAALFDQVVEELISRPKPIIIDEVDYLVRGGAVEILRDINDMTNTPVIMLGMEHIDKKLKRFRHLYDRFTTVVRFDLFDRDEVETLATQICTAKLSKCAIDFIANDGQGKLRLTTSWFTRAEQLAKRNNFPEITAEHLRSFKRG